jgi:HlyD family secretion protein
MSVRRWLLGAALVAIAALAYLPWESSRPAPLPSGFVATNGRIEGTEVDVATKLQGRVVAILVDEGDLLTSGQVVARMDTDVLLAQLREAEGKHRESMSAVEAALSTVTQREKEKAAAEAVVAQREAELDAETRHFARAQKLVERAAETRDNLDSFRASFLRAKATLVAAQANVAAANAALATAKSLVVLAKASVDSAKATMERVQADIDDSSLKAPRDGRVQYRVAQPGEVLDAGGKVLNMVDLTDVYMTFFLPTDEAGRVRQGAEVHLVLDALPEAVIPARATFVADVAQFTPKTVETAVERQKLTFRIKAHIDKELLRKHIHKVKTGLPGMAYVQLDPEAEWPAHLKVVIPNE